MGGDSAVLLLTEQMGAQQDQGSAGPRPSLATMAKPAVCSDGLSLKEVLLLFILREGISVGECISSSVGKAGSEPPAGTQVHF